MTRARNNPWAVLVFLCLGFFMVLLDVTIVNIAIPSMIDGLKASLDQVIWVLNAYTLTYAVLLITAGRLGDRFGQRNLFTAGLAVFVVASAACGLAQDPNQLIVARIVQAVGGALLTPQTLAILTTIFPPARRGAAFGIWGGIAGIATIAGPTVGGLLVTYLDWRWIFFVNVPIGIVALAGSLLIIPDLRPGRAAGVEPVGVLLASAGLFGITFGLIEGQRYNWGTVTGFISIPLIIAAGVLLVVLFFFWDHTRAAPMVPLSLFRERNFSLMNWVGAIISFGMIGLFLPLTIYLQSGLGFSAIKAGLTLLPMSLVSLPLAPIAGRLADRIGGKWILFAGLSLFATGMAIIDWRASIDSTWLTFLPGAVVAGVGLGCTFAPMATVAMRDIKPQMAGAASGLLNTTRQLGGAIGSALIGAVLQNRLSVALHDEAVKFAAQLPPQLPPQARQRFVDAFSSAGKGGLEVGRSSSSSFANVPGVPPQVAEQIGHVAREVFAYAFIDAMRPTLAVPILALAVGALSCLAVKRLSRGAEEAPARSAETTAPAA
ncbi:DHA2 family efflux MFS transporter permease subunit [Candidatus Nephthysia bennettiae]|uniref:DHA2 family efflux MFS transporter permease subunit n=1 Tax=Candidatus Nephthysia bennettiae TaxID=3127016 RepID=A0A934K715_9BACT|nr:DHA2 family efflux MFS transporter permease subunit [Candidatus Dormibacteraeota bacterium]MBJ7612515.1 DHA2 family efflux MFS transporter permease subunit [Candidatus Dormibacteraeota bacterium]